MEYLNCMNGISKGGVHISNWNVQFYKCIQQYEYIQVLVCAIFVNVLLYETLGIYLPVAG